MDSATLTTIATTLTGVIGGMYGGIKYGKQSVLSDAAATSSIAADTVEMLQTQVGHLEDVNRLQGDKIDELTNRIVVLEDLVTQRAAVGEVHEEVKNSRHVIDRIAGKLGA